MKTRLAQIVSVAHFPVAMPLGVALLNPSMAHAYVGPGAGLTAIGTLLALILALALAVVGFVWYPLKRRRRKRAERARAAESGANRE